MNQPHDSASQPRNGVVESTDRLRWAAAVATRGPLRLWRTSLEVLRAPRVTLIVSGGPHARRMYAAFTSPHERFRITQAKRWGCALVQIPSSFEEYLGGKPKELLRRKRRLAERLGYRHRLLPARDYLDDILEINRSAPERQGRPMPDLYLDRESVIGTFGDRLEIHGIVDGSGRLRAYAWAPTVGDAMVVELVLGHADHLENGVMFLLLSEIVHSAITEYEQSGRPQWVMYDTFWGASEGLAYFKRRLGFRPYTVRWVWSDAPDGRSLSA